MGFCHVRSNTRFILKLVFLFSALLFSQQSFAWNFIGHAVIAQVAYDQLTPKAKQQVNLLVKVLGHEYPNVKSFQDLASWADSIKQDGVTEFNDWHFIDRGFSPTNMRLPYYPQENVAWAIQQNQQTLATAKNPFDQALALAFLSHFVGDIEQPMHCITRVTTAHPKGDQGGNLYPIQISYATNLHSLWDQGAGLYIYDPNKSVPQQIQRLTQQIEQQYPEKIFTKELSDPNPHRWAESSFYIAKDFAYTTPSGKAPSAEYIAKAQQIVLQQSALAGYRLAGILNKTWS